MPIFFKSTALLALLFFLMAIAVQYNDPDALLWMAIYALAGMATLFFLLGKLPLFAPLVLAIGYIIGGIMSWPDVFEGIQGVMGDNNNIEKGREALGLFISAVLMLVLALGVFMSKKTASE